MCYILIDTYTQLMYSLKITNELVTFLKRFLKKQIFKENS